MKFIHVSDLHYHRDPKKNVEADLLLRTLKDNYTNHNLIVTGDITDDGDPMQYNHAAKALGLFSGNIFISPGNHDFGGGGCRYQPERARRFDELLSLPLGQGGTFSFDTAPVVNVVADGPDQVMLIALDTNLETQSVFDFACGEVGKEQLGYLDGILAGPGRANMKRILFFHHHPFIHGDPLLELRDAKDLMRVIYGRVDVVLFGHKHTSGLWQDMDGIPWILASDNSPGRSTVIEIEIAGGIIGVKKIPVNPG